jgi:endonuclease/exonuclease/phosphatase family metal-dependent hydrolase
VLSVIASSASAQEGDRLKVITYNVQFLPAPPANERPNPEYRAKRIVEEVGKFDIVGLQEAFFEAHRQIIVDGVRTAWGGELNYVVSPKVEAHAFNGGCLILTRWPVLEENATVYTHFSSPRDYGIRADGFAAKGVIHARIARSKDCIDEWVDVFVTHLEARADELRPLQYKELGAFIRQHADAAHPALLLGDLNTNGLPEYRADQVSQYSLLMQELREARPEAGFVDVWPQLMGNARGGTTHQESTEVGKRIDYVLLSNPQPPNTGLKAVNIRVNLYQDPEVVALSDHNAVEAEFEWTPDPSEPDERVNRRRPPR